MRPGGVIGFAFGAGHKFKSLWQCETESVLQTMSGPKKELVGKAGKSKVMTSHNGSKIAVHGVPVAEVAQKPRKLHQASGTGLHSDRLFHKDAYELAAGMDPQLEKHALQQRLDAAFGDPHICAYLFVGKPFQN
jgi:hypothetical protein